MPAPRRMRFLALAIIFILTTFYYLANRQNTWNYGYTPSYIPSSPDPSDQKVHWKPRPDRFPVKSHLNLPTGKPIPIPRIQASRPIETEEQKTERLRRRDAVRGSFLHSWDGYTKHAWLRDEVTPITGLYRDTFGGWAATLVDSLDTLWIMGMKEEFEIAVKAAETIDFTTTEADIVNVFETTIRYLGGFLAAYDVSDGKYSGLLKKAVEVGELLMGCFDTPNRMPISRWDWEGYTKGKVQKAPTRMLVSELGSLSLEFTRLTQLTKNPKYYDAIQRISNEFEKSQNKTHLPGMWPVSIDASGPKFSEDNFFTLGGMSDSLYEYLPKQYLLLGGLLTQPKSLYETFIEVAKKHLFFRIYNPKNEKLSVSGDVRVKKAESIELIPRGQHLTCFTGGMVALAAKIFSRPDELALAAELVDGCIWAYDSNPHGVAPELFTLMPCPKEGSCIWSEEVWFRALDAKYSTDADRAASENADVKKSRMEKLIGERRFPLGFTGIDDRRYILRPEALESVFIMYRVTGEQKWADAMWRMFQAIEKISRTNVAAAAVVDVTVSEAEGGVEQMDSMESFWLGETLKYAWLCFDGWGGGKEGDEAGWGLDEWVFNTEAHLFRRPK